MSVAIAPPAQADSTRISTRMLVLFSTLFLLLLAIIAATVVALVASTEAEQWQGRQTEAARSATFRVLSFIENAQRGLSIGAQFSDPNAYPDIPAQLLRENPSFDEVVVVDVRGRVLANEFRDLPLLAGTAAGRQAEWLVRWLAAAETETPDSPTDTTFPTQPIPVDVVAPYLSPVQRTADGQTYLIMSLPTEEFNGVIAVRLNLGVFSQLIAELTFGETGTAYVASETGVVLAHTDASVVAANTTIADRPEFIRAPMFDLLTEPYDNFQGEGVIGSVERIPGLNWVVFTEISQTEALSATRTAVIVLVVVTLIVFVIILTAGSSLLRWLVFRPLASLRASLEQVAQGNFDVQVQVNRRDEVGEVTKAFNDMIRIVNERAIERERLIRELQAAKRMADENSRLKSEFLSTMSHELRTPMNAIEGFVGIILNRMGGTDYNDKTGTYLTRVRANSQRLLSLINDFLDLSRVESGR
ncbi:MAG: HAMP domain-containing protein, partial [Anaerolineae bacterium]|nr:HAMP domain-containing protein [Anaerolineae bacterium]